MNKTYEIPCTKNSINYAQNLLFQKFDEFNIALFTTFLMRPHIQSEYIIAT